MFRMCSIHIRLEREMPRQLNLPNNMPLCTVQRKQHVVSAGRILTHRVRIP